MDSTSRSRANAPYDGVVPGKDSSLTGGGSRASRRARAADEADGRRRGRRLGRLGQGGGLDRRVRLGNGALLVPRRRRRLPHQPPV